MLRERVADWFLSGSGAVDPSPKARHRRNACNLARFGRLSNNGYAIARGVALVVLGWLLAEVCCRLSLRPTAEQFADCLRREAEPVGGQKSSNYELCAVTRLKNGGEWLPEWIEYHRLLGVNHFIIADECSTDNRTLRVLEAYKTNTEYVTFLNGDEVQLPGVELGSRCQRWREGKLTRMDYPLINSLTQLAKASGCEWAAVLDVDEFMAFTDGGAAEYGGNLRTFLARQRTPWVRGLNWVMGHQGQEFRPDGLRIEAYLYGRLDPAVYKSIARLSTVRSWLSPHRPHRWQPCTQVHLMSLGDLESQPGETIFRRVPGSERPVPHPASDFFIKHYRIPSWGEYMRSRGSRKEDTKLSKVISWTQDPRAKWAEGRINPKPENVLGNGFTLSMAERVRQALTERANWLPAFTPQKGEAPASGGG